VRRTITSSKQKLAPIALFVYNRPVHTKNTIASLLRNSEAKNSVLYIFSDAPKTDKDVDRVADVRQIIGKAKGFKKIIIRKQEQNQGLAKSIILGVSQVLSEHGRIIVLEDDLEFSPFFLQYMNEQLNLRESDKHIFSISGYRFPISAQPQLILSRRTSSWGWATWNNRWQQAKWKKSHVALSLLNPFTFMRLCYSGPDIFPTFMLYFLNKVDVWALRWQVCHCKYNAYCVYPSKSYLANRGNDGSGVHSKKTDFFNVYVTQEFSKKDTLTPIKGKTFDRHFFLFFIKNLSLFNFVKKIFMPKKNKIKSPKQ
jgi:hypothetical protein